MVSIQWVNFLLQIVQGAVGLGWVFGLFSIKLGLSAAFHRRSACIFPAERGQRLIAVFCRVIWLGRERWQPLLRKFWGGGPAALLN